VRKSQDEDEYEDAVEEASWDEDILVKGEVSSQAPRHEEVGQIESGESETTHVGDGSATSSVPHIRICGCDVVFDSDANPPWPLSILVHGVIVPIHATTDPSKKGLDPVFAPYIPDYGRKTKMQMCQLTRPKAIGL